MEATIRTRTSEQSFEGWLQTLPALGYDRLWVTNNMPALEKRWRETNGAPMEPCPPPPARRYDPYRDI